MEMQIVGFPEALQNNTQSYQAPDVTSGNYTLSATEAQSAFYAVQGTPGVSRDLTFPVGAANPVVVWIYNSSNANVVVKYAGGGGTVTITAAAPAAAVSVSAALGVLDLRW